MFQFPGCPPRKLWIHLRVSRHCPGRVPPFGYPRIVACLQLPVAFRSWPRPSSAVGALASTLCSSSLDFFVALLLRPTYNFTKIYTWLLLFSAILKYAESFTKRFGECSCKTMYEKATQIGIKYDLRSICKSVYSSKVSSALCDRILELQTISASQRCNKDFSGSDVTFENELMTFTFR